MKEGMKKNERERRWRCIYIKGDGILQVCHWVAFHQRDLRLHERWPRLGKNELDAEIRAASRRKTRDCVLIEKTKVVMTWSELT